ncbi:MULTISPECIES: ATP-dependent metallopeptidase FtsH/Yme1/Tma family protein [Peribacillus]|uniref:ATP-dependent metallopeptidase FtsH/Yme1/Tma family protein n=1 Tax=Peribacillus TaxID=2675229 RepID=UPI001F4EB035|nr:MULTISPECIES: ATP-dependent metallopeptidase FtsH/Yme1/Tma family protein [unclassified Peribacillus]MCK1981324.1 ATP-dependent metallopeptidase FtsH/Yme1/Tma family protein [Peribacillus sp. Aquil_B1]MCK2006929.1 ATP-dependent metallopeptidase FtsH/Yme1/Tma family protein [Peribacillus sp. Aquil_B8]
MKQIFRSKIFYLIIFMVTLGIVLVFNNENEPTELTEDEFFTTLEDGKVTFLKVEPQKSVIEISGQLAGYEKDQYFIASVPNSEIWQERMNNAAEENGIEKIEVTPEDEATSGWVTFLTTTIPFMIVFILIFVIFLFLFVMKRMKQSK